VASGRFAATPINRAAQDHVPRGGEGMDQFKCGKCGKMSPKPGMCCGLPMKKS
jgi:hypothetical protein